MKKTKVIKKVKKLLAFGEDKRNISEDESHQMIDKAQELIDKYRITDSELEEGNKSDGKFFSYITNLDGFPEWSELLIVILSNYQGCIACKSQKEGKQLVYTVVGDEVDVELTKIMFDFYYNQIQIAYRFHQEYISNITPMWFDTQEVLLQQTDKTDEFSFCLGFVTRIQGRYIKIQQQREQAESRDTRQTPSVNPTANSQALTKIISTKLDEVTEFLRSKNVEQKDLDYTDKEIDYEGFCEGKKAAKGYKAFEGALGEKE